MSAQEIVRRLAGITLRCTFALVLVLSVIGTAYAQVAEEPTDDPYVKVPYTSTVKAPSSSDKTGGGSSDSVTINTIDPSGFPEICTYVTVTHNGETVEGLDPDSFCVRQDGIVIDSFTAVEQTADSCITRICLVIDRSGSMTDGGKLTAAKNAAKRFIRNMGPLDRAAVVSFGNCWTVNQNFTSDTTLLIAAVNSLSANGRTAALDGIWKGLDLTKLEAGSNKAVIALSDGMENWSQNCGTGLPDGLYDAQGFTDDLNFLDSISAAIGAPVYTISLGSDFDPDYLQDIANATGGEYHHAPTNETLDAIYDAIKISICTRYLICYTSPDTIANGDCHDVIICRDNADGDKTGVGDCYVCDTTEYCEPYPPVISIEVDPACRRWGQPVELCATVTDSDTPPESLIVKLYYRIFEPGGAYTEISPSRVGNVWCYTIPAAMIPCGKDSIEFYFTATDGTSSVSSPSNAPASSHQVSICPNHPPTCEFTVQPTPPLCTPPIDFVGLNLTDIDNNKMSCTLYGDGELVDGGWQFVNPTPNDTAHVYIVCIDSCGDSCNISFDRFYPERQLIPCNIPDGGDTAFFLCDPGLVSFPVTGGEGSSCTIISGGGALVNGNWEFNATKDTTITFTIECIGICDSCHSTYTVAIDVNSAPICGPIGGEPGPNAVEVCDTTVYFCDSGEVCVPYVSFDPDGNLAFCRITAGPGALVNGAWCFTATASGIYTVTIECVDSCQETCTQQLCAEVFIDEKPVITCPPDVAYECDSVGAFGEPTVVDGGFSPATISRDVTDSVPGNCPGTYTLRIRYIASDTCGHADTCFQSVQVIDTTAPVIVCALPDTFECDEVPTFWTPPVATDNCDPNPVVTQIAAISAPNALCVYAYSLSIAWEARDACGNADTCYQSVLVVDTTPPDLTCPPDTTLSCEDEFPRPGGIKAITTGADIKCPPPVIWPFGVPTATDNCDPDPWLNGYFGRILDPNPCHFVFEAIYTAVDTCGNLDTCIQIVTVVDTTDPVIECPVSSRYECDEIPTSFAPPGAKDACNEVTVSEIGRRKEDSTCAYEYTLVIVWEAKDACGNADTCEQRVQIFDDAPPTITVPDKVTYNCDSVPAEYPRPTAQDQCDPNPTLNLAGVDTTKDGCLLIIQLSWKATDACGNESGTYLQYVNVVDRTAPVLTCPDTLVFECDSVPDLDSLPGPLVSDNCDDSVKLERFLASSVAAPCVEQQHITILWVATDDCGNVDSCTQVINVVDTTAPVLDKCDTLFVFECYQTFKEAESAAPILPTATDNCDPAPVVTYNFITSGGTYPCNYEYKFAIYARDRCGNVSDTCYQTIRIVDTTPPVISCPVDTVVIECPNQIILQPPSATDNCGYPVDVRAVSDTIVDSTCLGSYFWVITWEATDYCGNKDTCEQVIRYRDTTPPVIDCVPGGSVECDDTVLATPPTAFDLCDPNPDVTEIGRRVVDSLSPCNYVLVVAWEARDDCGNADTCESRYVIFDETPPVITCPKDTLYACDLVPDTSLWPKPTATDNCDSNVTIALESFDSTFGQCINDKVYLLGWSATDDCNNTSRCVQTVYVRDTAKPEITCPADTVLECDEFDVTKVADKTTPQPVWTYGEPTATDNCDDTVYTYWTYGPLVSENPCRLQFRVIYWAYDNCNNWDTCSQLVTVVDSTPPVITCPPVDTVLCSQLPTFYVPPTATDNCDLDVSVTQLGEPYWGEADCPFPDTIIVTWVAVDNCENADTCEQIIHVIDNDPPVLFCEDLRYECDSIPTEWPKPGAKDLCDPAPVVTLLSNSDTTLGACPQRYSFILTWEAKDACGNADTCKQTVYIYDETPPEITCPNDTILACQDIPHPLLDELMNQSGAVKIPVVPFAFGTPTVIDNCDPSPEIYRFVQSETGTYPCAKYFVLGYFAVDSCGNVSDTCFQNASIVDTIAPEITCPPDTTIDCVLANVKATWTVGEKVTPPWPFGNATATDNCTPVPNIIGPIYIGDLYTDSCGYTMQFLFIATDQCQLADSCIQLVTVIDTIAPTFDCPKDTTIECNNICAAEIKSGKIDCLKAATPFNVSDLCDPEPFVGIVGYEILDSLCPVVVEYRIVAKDHCGNTSDTCYWKLTIEDTTAPRIDCPAPARIACNALWDGVFDGDSLGWPQAYDECDATPEILLTGYSTIGEGCPYIIRRAFVAIDTCGNISDTCYQDITVFDDIPPIITCPDTAFFECDFDTSLIPRPTYSDNCDDSLELRMSRDSVGVSNCAYELRITWTVIDDCQNSASCLSIVIVGDSTKPEITCPPDTIVDCSELERDGSGKAMLQSFASGAATKDANGCYEYDFRYGKPTGSDNCDSTVEMCLWGVGLLDSDSCRVSFVLVFTGIDDCGNISDTCHQIVTYTDTTPPVVVCAPDTTVYCAGDIIDECFPGKSGNVTLDEKGFLCDFRLIDTVYDACDEFVEYEAHLSYHFEKCPYYIRAAIWAVDDCGNVSDTCFWQVTFADTLAPVITCPPNVNVECGADPGDWGVATAVDDCDTLVVPVLFEVDTVATQGNCYIEIERTFTATDLCGNSSRCTQTIIVGDSTAPVIVCPPDTTVNCNDLLVRNGDDPKSLLTEWAPLAPKGFQECLPYNGMFGLPTATDNCSGYEICLYDVTGPEGDSCAQTFTLHFFAVDSCGNADTCQQQVTFVDDEGPVLVCASDTTIYCDRDKAACIELKGEAPFKITDEKFLCGFRMIDTVYDVCCEEVEVFCRLTYHLNKCPAYIKAFIWAVDCCGNYSDTCTWILNIDDTTAPVITCPIDLTYECSDVQGEWGWPTATDNCDDEVAITLYDQDTVTEGCQTVVTRIFSAKDRCLNESRCVQTITVSDTTDPICDLPDNDTIFLCSADSTVCLPVSATDNCDQAVICEVVDGAGQIVNGQWCYMPTGPGPVTAYVRCTDDCGNTCDGSFTITFELNNAPICEVPNDTTIYSCEPLDIKIEGRVIDPDGNLQLASFTVQPGESKSEKSELPDTVSFSYTVHTDTDLVLCLTVRGFDFCGEACSTSYCVRVDITEPPVCYPTPDTSYAFCNPEEVCLQIQYLDPTASSTSDVLGPNARGGKGKKGGGTSRGTNNAQPLKSLGGAGCTLISGPGLLRSGYWCWTPPDYDTSVTIIVECRDTCNHSCTNEFTVDFDMNENPICSLLVDLIDPICTPDTDFVPYLSIDPDGSTECSQRSGPGSLVPGGWMYPNPVPGTSAHVVIVCIDTCGDSCMIDFTRNYPERVPVICNVPDDIDTLICQPTTLSWPVSGGEGSECTVVSGPGSIDVGSWFYYADHDTSFCVTIECKSLCDSCRAEFCVTIELNDPPVCELPNDTTIFLCDTMTICLPVSASDSNGNFSHCEIDYDEKGGVLGYITNGLWCFFATQPGPVTVPIICYDSCGAVCRGEFTVTFEGNEPPVCELPSDTSIFLCDPATVCLPIGATDVDGNFSYCDFADPSKTNGSGYIQNGQWCYDVTQDAQVTVYIACYDSCGAVCYGDFTVTFDVNEPPVCNEVPDTSIFQCLPTEFCLPVGSKDPDGQEVTCQVISGLGAVEQGQWCFTPTQSGVYNVTIRCTDPCGDYCDESFSVTVNLNDPPECITPPTDTTIYLCEATNVCIGGFGGTDPDGNLRECIILDDDKTITGTPQGGLEWCDFISADQTVLLTIQCIDSCDAICTRDVYIHFIMNIPPVINLGADISTQVGDGQVCFNYTVSDPDQVLGLIEELILSPGGTVIDTAANTICWTPEEGGNFMFVGKVTDSCGADDFDTAFVLVSQPAPPNCFLPNDTTVVLCGTTQICKPVSATSLNPPVSCQVTGGYGTVSNGNWCFTPQSAGEYQTTITCTDDAGAQCSGTFTVTVQMNQAPTCNVRDTSVFLCEPGQVCIPVSGTDPEGGAVTCTKTSGPGTLTNGVWCYNATTDASFSVTFQCTDACGTSCQTTIYVTININVSPSCAFPANQVFTICPGDMVCLGLEGSDPDGNLVICGQRDGLGEVLPTGENGKYQWCYKPTGQGIVPVSVYCVDECGDSCITERLFRILFSDPAFCATQPPGQIVQVGPGELQGDVNGSGDVNIADLAMLTSIVNQMTAAGKYQKTGVTTAAAYQVGADVNCDGRVDKADVAYLTEYLFGNGPKPCDPTKK